MIDAVDALLLPRAQLTEDERKAADDMAAALEAHVQLVMQRRGCDEFHTKETNQNIIAEVNLRLVRKNWRPTWHAKMELSQLSNQRRAIGFQVTLEPTTEAYQMADARREN